MDCVIRVISGPDQGREHRLQPGPNLIGRGNKAALRLTPEDVSWEHAVVTRQGDEYYVENLSALGTWVGDARISGRVRLRPRDTVRLSGDTALRLESADGAGGALGSRTFLVAAVIVMLGVLAAVAFYQFGGEGEAPGGSDWAGAYNTLAPWLREQAARGRAPAEAPDLYQTAWRLEQAGDYAHSQPQWLRLQVILAADEGRMRSLALADQHADALQNLLAPPGREHVPSDEQKSAALAQFVQRRLTYSTKMKGGSSLLRPS